MCIRDSTTGAQITFQTNNASLGFVLDMHNYLLIYSLNDSQFKLENGKFGETISGRYDVNGTFTKEGTATLENQTLHAKGGILYKVTYSSQQSLTSNTIENIGNNL